MKKKILLIMFVFLFAVSNVVIAAESEYISRSFIVDKTVPNVPTLGGIPANWVNKDVTLTVLDIEDPVSNEVSAGVDRVEYSVKGDAKTHSGSEQFTISVTSEGENQITAKTVDKVGNISPEASGIVRIDKTNPSITLNGVEEGKTYYTSVVPAFSAADSGSGLTSCSATLTKDAGAPAPFTSGSEISQPGLYNLAVTATDNAGNEETVSVSFNIAAPVSPEKPTVTAQGDTIQIEWSAVEGATGYLVKDGDSQIADVTTTGYLHEGLLPNSPHRYTIIAYSQMGNSTESSEAAVFTLANEPSNLQVTGKTSTSLAVSWEANSNPEGTEYSVSITGGGKTDTVPFTPNMLTHEFTGLTLGEVYTISVKSRNGDQVETNAVTIEVSTNKAPVLTISTPESGSAYSHVEGHNVITVSGSVSDEDNDTVTITATINNLSKSVKIEKCQWGKPFTIIFNVVEDNVPEGPYTIGVVADDGR